MMASCRQAIAVIILNVIKILFWPCTINPPRQYHGNSTRPRRLVLGPRIPCSIVFSLLCILALSYTFLEDFCNAYYQPAIYADVDNDENSRQLPYYNKHQSSGGATSSAADDHDDDDEFAIFYHIFVPPEEPEQSNALRIIDEQMHQISKSYAATAAVGKPTTLYFNTLGTSNVVTQEYMTKTYCNKFHLNCTFLRHYNEGMEELTLQNVQDYCKQSDDFLDLLHGGSDAQQEQHGWDPTDHPKKAAAPDAVLLTSAPSCKDNVHGHGCDPTDPPRAAAPDGILLTSAPSTTDDSLPKNNKRRVVYMHNKGSFHSNKFNEQWRRLMTYSVTSQECLEATRFHHKANGNQNQECNLCGLYFVAERGFFMPGNFWTARCDYIVRLQQPLDFEDQMTEVVKEALLKHLKHEFAFDMYNFIEDNYGVDRYAAELWVGSHPTIQPCDLSNSKTENFGTGFADAFYEWVLSIWDPYQLTHKSLQWSMAPSLPLKIPAELRHLSPWGFEAFLDRWNPWQLGYKIDRLFDLALLQETPTKLRQREAQRMREFTYLPGNLFKWISIYGQVPPQHSWIWEWFPDGDTWWKAIEDHGNQAVEIVTQNITEEGIEFIAPVFHCGWKRLTWFNSWFLRYFREI